MKKLALILALALSGAAYSHASLIVNWGDPTGFVMNDGTTPILDGGVGTTALVQLIWTGDGVQDDALIGGLVGGANEILAQQTITDVQFGNPYAGTFSFDYGPEADRSGFLYVRVFQGGTSIGNVNAGDWYFTGMLTATVNNPGGAAPPDDVYAGDPPYGGTGDFGTFALNQQVVPEPTTLALAALGVLGLVARRFRRS